MKGTILCIIEAQEIATRLAASTVGILVCTIYREHNTLEFPSTSTLDRLAMLHCEASASSRSANLVYLCIMGRRPNLSKSIKVYNGFSACVGDLKLAIRGADTSGSGTLAYLWILERVLRKGKVSQAYDAVLRPDSNVPVCLDNEKLAELHKAMELLLSTTDHSHWIKCEDDALEDFVQWWCPTTREKDWTSARTHSLYSKGTRSRCFPVQ